MKLINGQVTKVSWSHKGGDWTKDSFKLNQTVTTWSGTNAGQKHNTVPM